MHDIKAIREHAEDYDKAWYKRGLLPQSSPLLKLDDKRRTAIATKQEAEAERNALSKDIGRAKAQGDDSGFQELRKKVDTLKNIISTASEEERHYTELLQQHLQALPNLPEADVPEGKDEHANKEIRLWGTPRSFSFEMKPHDALGENLGFLDFQTAALIAGARFVILKGPLARLERALAAFMLDLHTQEFGYQEVSPPSLVRENTLFGTGQLPKFAEDQFQTTDGRWLIPTAEAPLTNLVRERIMQEEELPLRFTAATPCYRAEAGSAGRDTRGLIRMHQFTKVELVSITTPEHSQTELERMTSCAEEVLKRLDLPYRVLLLSSGDMGFSAQKTYDLEVWFPSQKTYREISSCSNCGSFQARRMKARYRRGQAGSLHHIHSLNGSGLAIGRTLAAILENYQQENGDIAVPAVLRPYMGGREMITHEN